MLGVGGLVGESYRIVGGDGEIEGARKVEAVLHEPMVDKNRALEIGGESHG